MKRGLIIYITGEEPKEKEISTSDFGSFQEGYDMCEFVAPLSGRYDIHEAWYNLVVKGSHSIICRFGAFKSNGEFEMTERELRVC